jgi:hypothetical protein
VVLQDSQVRKFSPSVGQLNAALQSETVGSGVAQTVKSYRTSSFSVLSRTTGSQPGYRNSVLPCQKELIVGSDARRSFIVLESNDIPAVPEVIEWLLEGECRRRRHQKEERENNIEAQPQD